MQKLKARGWSNTVIAEQLGVSEGCVRKDLKAAGSYQYEPAPVVEVQLPERAAKVLELKELGHTEREIAKEIGVHQSTVNRDLDAIATAKKGAAEKAKEAAPKVEGKDGKKYPAKRPKKQPASKPEPEPERTPAPASGSLLLRRCLPLLGGLLVFCRVPASRLRPA